MTLKKNCNLLLLLSRLVGEVRVVVLVVSLPFSPIFSLGLRILLFRQYLRSCGCIGWDMGLCVATVPGFVLGVGC